MPDTPESDQLQEILQAIERLKQEKDKADLEKQIAEAQKATLAALLPVAATKPLEGTIKAESVVIEAQIQTYEALKDVAAQIRKDLEKEGDLVVYYDKDVNLLAHYAAVKCHVEYLKEAYVKLLTQQPTPPPPVAVTAGTIAAAIPPILLPMAADAVMRSVLDVVALFRTDVNLKGEKVDIIDEALIAAIASDAPPRIHFPLLMPGTFDDVSKSEIMKEFNAVIGYRRQAEQLEIAYNAQSEEEKKKDPFRAKLPFLKALNDRSDKLIDSFVTTTGTDGLNGLARLLRAEELRQKLANKKLLFLKVLASGGNTRTERKLWSTKFKANGGCVVAYIVFAGPTGSITKAGIRHFLTPYHENRVRPASGPQTDPGTTYTGIRTSAE